MKRFSFISLLILLPMLGGCFFNNGQKDSKGDDPFIPEKQYFLQIQEVNSNYVFVGKEPLQYDCLVFADGEDISEQAKDDIVWNSSNPSIATIENGLLTGIKEGEITIKAEYKDVKAEIEAHSRVYADSFSIEDSFTIYMDDAFDIEYDVSPSNASVIFANKSEDLLKIENNQFIPLREGTAYVEVTTYAENFDPGLTDNFIENKETVSVRIGPNHYPYFVFNEGKADKGEITIPKNKYSSLDLLSLGLSAYSYDGQSDLSNKMKIVGDYDLKESGEYDLTIEVEDSSYVSTFSLTLVIEDYEIKAIPVDSYNLNDVLSYEIEITTDASVYSNSFRKIGFDASFKGINYDAYDLDIYASVNVSAKDSDHGQTTNKLLNANKIHLSFGQTSIYMEYEQEYMDANRNYYLLNSLTYVPSITINGNVYQYIYY